MAREAARLRFAVALWDAITAKAGAEELKLFVRPGPLGDFSWWLNPRPEIGIDPTLIASMADAYSDDPIHGRVRFRKIEPEPRPEFVCEEQQWKWFSTTGVLKRAAERALTDLVNRSLALHPATVILEIDGEPKAVVTPTSPMSAGWYGLLRLIAREMPHPRQCERETCRRWIPGDRREDLKFCNATCRSAQSQWEKRREQPGSKISSFGKRRLIEAE
jgi:hypothetical protein